MPLNHARVLEVGAADPMDSYTPDMVYGGEAQTLQEEDTTLQDVVDTAGEIEHTPRPSKTRKTTPR